MRGRSIQKSDGSREEAVLESVGTWPQTFVSFSRQKKVEERMSGLRGVLNYAGCFSRGSGKCRQSQWMGGWFAWWIGLNSWHFIVPCGLGQSRSHTELWYNQKECFLCASVKVGETRRWHAKFPSSSEKVEALMGFLNYSVSMDRLLVIWTPKNLKLSTLSTSSLLM